jgi:amino acid transporter
VCRTSSSTTPCSFSVCIHFVACYFPSITNQSTAFVTFFGWKLFKRTKFVKPHEADLIWERPSIDAYEETFYGPPVSFWREIVQVVGIGRVKGGNDPRRGSING